MHGKNLVAHTRSISDTYLLHSIFYTIQGEGPWAGYPTIFVRFAGCNLRCFWCDTDFESISQSLPLEVMAEIIREHCNKHNCHRVVFTGGEPMLQQLGTLIDALPMSLTFQVETAGTVMPFFSLKALVRTLIVVSPKTPVINAEIAKNAYAYKYIIRFSEIDWDDGLPVASTQDPNKNTRTRLFRPAHLSAQRIYVQPCDEAPDTAATEANTRLAAQIAMQFGYKLSIQLHKIVGLP